MWSLINAVILLGNLDGITCVIYDQEIDAASDDQNIIPVLYDGFWFNQSQLLNISPVCP